MSITNQYILANPSIEALLEGDGNISLVGRVRYQHDRGIPGTTDPLYTLDILIEKDGEQIAQVPLLETRPNWENAAYLRYQLSPAFMIALLAYEAVHIAARFGKSTINGKYDAITYSTGEKIQKIDLGNLLELRKVLYLNPDKPKTTS